MKYILSFDDCFGPNIKIKKYVKNPRLISSFNDKPYCHTWTMMDNIQRASLLTLYQIKDILKMSGDRYHFISNFKILIKEE